MGCIMVRQCHSNTCPVGVCTQDETPARQVHRHAGQGRQPHHLHRRGGARDPGRAGLRAARRDHRPHRPARRRSRRGGEHLDDLDLNPLLVQGRSRRRTRPTAPSTRPQRGARHAGRPDRARRRAAASNAARRCSSTYTVRNTAPRHRHAGIVAHRAQVRHGRPAARPPDGQAARARPARAWAPSRCQGLTHRGDRRGQRLCRQGPVGRDHHRPADAAARARRSNAIIGNTVLYGATVGPAVRGGPGGRALRACATPGADGRGRGLRRERLRIHDRRHGRDPGPGRRQLRAPA